MIRATLAAALSIVLVACAGGLLKSNHPPRSPAPESSGRASPREIMVGNARSMIGQPYRFGGAAPGGFDCSGLVAYAATAAGIHVPRTAREQLHAGTPVPRRELRPGDLVFMHLARKELHVGIAIGDERFIHAPSAGGHVRIDSLAAPHYARRFLKARRIIETP